MLKIGMVGLDTSHVVAFTELLNNTENPYHVSGGKVTVAFPGGSSDFKESFKSVEGFTNQLREKYHVRIVDTIEEVAEQSDVIMLESLDGRVHLHQFHRLAPFGKPVYVDKPFATTSQDAVEMVRLAKQFGVPMMSSSSLRFAAGLQEILDQAGQGSIIGSDCFGPTPTHWALPGLFCYGIHTVEILYTIMGPGCLQVTTASNDEHDQVTGIWKDGRIGTIRGNRKGNFTFGALIHREKGTQYANISAHPKPYYASLLEQVMGLFQTKLPVVEPEVTLEIIRFIEAANESGTTGKKVML